MDLDQDRAPGALRGGERSVAIGDALGRRSGSGDDGHAGGKNAGKEGWDTVLHGGLRSRGAAGIGAAPSVRHAAVIGYKGGGRNQIARWREWVAMRAIGQGEP
ncbi:hypothetical protein GCM10009106_16140 [Sphingomonas japonica]